MAAIVDEARRQMAGGGYGTLSIARVARELDVAQNAVYWYFPTKDHLFVAAVDAILHETLDRKPRQGPTVERLVWFAGRLAEFQHLRVTMRDRAAASDVVAAYERDVVALLRTLLVGTLGGEVSGDRVEQTADAVLALCEGVLLRELPAAERDALIRFGFERLVRR